jgi:hypothetical protein
VCQWRIDDSLPGASTVKQSKGVHTSGIDYNHGVSHAGSWQRDNGFCKDRVI